MNHFYEEIDEHIQWLINFMNEEYPNNYELVIDNNSGTIRSTLQAQMFLRNDLRSPKGFRKATEKPMNKFVEKLAEVGEGMTINIQELLDKGYKEFPPTRFDTADKCFQKRFRTENGDTLYFINVNMYYSWGTIPENFEVKTQLYQKGTHEPVNLKFFCGWTLADVEDYVQRIYEVGFEPYDE